MDLTDVQWELLKPLVEPKTPRATVARYAFSAGSSVGVLRTGAQWSEMPRKYPLYQICHRRFQQWVRQGVLVEVLRTLAQDLRVRGQLDLAETFIDATFSGAKKGVCCWSNTPRRSGSVLKEIANVFDYLVANLDAHALLGDGLKQCPQHDLAPVPVLVAPEYEVMPRSRYPATSAC